MKWEKIIEAVTDEWLNQYQILLRAREKNIIKGNHTAYYGLRKYAEEGKIEYRLKGKSHEYRLKQ